MTVTSKIDITKPDERGLVIGLNEFSGCVGVAIAGILTGYPAGWFDPRTTLLIFGLVTVVLALAIFAEETLPGKSRAPLPTSQSDRNNVTKPLVRGPLSEQFDNPSGPDTRLARSRHAPAG